MKRLYMKLFILSLALMVFAADGFSQKSILFVGRSSYDFMSDVFIQDSLTAWGYAPDFWGSEEFATGVDPDFNNLDYSLYEGMVINESSDSKNLGRFGTTDDYPLPCVNLEGFAVASGSDRWSWVEADQLLQTAKGSGTADEEILIIKDNSHYITQDFNVGDEVPWSNSTVEVDQIVPVSIQEGTVAYSSKLGQIKAHAGSADYWNLLTVDEIGGSNNRLVYWGINVCGLDGFSDNTSASSGNYATPEFFTILRRSLEWVLGEDQGGVSVKEQLADQMKLVAFPNPASERVTVRFSASDAQDYTATLYNVTGQQVELWTRHSHAGQNYLYLDAHQYPSGIYQMRIDMEGATAVAKVVIQ